MKKCDRQGRFLCLILYSHFLFDRSINSKFCDLLFDVEDASIVLNVSRLSLKSILNDEIRYCE